MYNGFNGFLGNRASFMLDVVFLAMFAVVPVMLWSIYQVKYKQNFLLHKRVQIALGVILLLAVTVFEIDIRWNGWRDRAAESPYYSANALEGLVNWSLWIHLFFAISTTALWLYVIPAAIKRFPKPPTPAEYSARHAFWGKLAAIDMTMTAVTGWVFYWLAFVAK